MAKPMLERRRSLVLATLLLLAAGCDSPSDSRPGPPAVLEIVAGNGQESTVGESLPEPLVVRALDQTGRPVPDQSLTFVVVGGGGTVVASLDRTDSQGYAQALWTLGTMVADEQRVEARTVPRSASDAVVIAAFEAIGKPAAVATLAAVGSTDWTAPAGMALADSIAVTVTDQYGNRVPAVTVVWRIGTGDGTVSPETTLTDENGIARAMWTLGARVDTEHLLSAAVGTGLTTQFRATASAPEVVRLTRVSGDGQRATVGTALPEPLLVAVTLSDGRPLVGATVRWSIGSSGGSLSSDVAASDPNGRVSIGWTLGTAVGNYDVSANVDGAPPVVFSSTAEAGPPAIVSKVSGDGQSAGVRASVAEPLVTRVTDQYGNPVPGAVVRWAAGQGGSVQPDSSFTDESGVTRTSWTLGPAAGPASATGVIGGQVAAFSATARILPTRLLFVTPPVSANRLFVLKPAPAVAIVDEYGNTDTTSTAAVKLNLAGGTSPVSLFGSTANAVKGIATFNDVRVPRTGTYTITATSLGLADATSDPITISEPVPPAVPPEATLTPDYSLFMTPYGPTDSPGNNYWYGAGRIGNSRSLTSEGSSAMALAALRGAVGRTPTLRDRGLWEWYYPVTAGSSQITVRLTASVLADEVLWQGRVTSFGNGLFDHLVFEGRSKLDDSSGTWTIIDWFTDSVHTVVEWEHPQPDTWKIRWRAGIEPESSTLEYAAVGSTRSMKARSVFRSGIGYAVNQFEASWDTVRRTGWILTPAFNDWQKACWGERLENVSCSP